MRQIWFTSSHLVDLHMSWDENVNFQFIALDNGTESSQQFSTTNDKSSHWHNIVKIKLEAFRRILQNCFILTDTFGSDLERVLVGLPSALYKQSFLGIIRSTSAIFGLESDPGWGWRATGKQQDGLKQMTVCARKEQLKSIWANFHIDSTNTFSHDITFKTISILQTICWLKRNPRIAEA